MMPSVITGYNWDAKTMIMAENSHDDNKTMHILMHGKPLVQDHHYGCFDAWQATCAGSPLWVLPFCSSSDHCLGPMPEGLF
jgi:hypothetical protein